MTCYSGAWHLVLLWDVSLLRSKTGILWLSWAFQRASNLWPTTVSYYTWRAEEERAGGSLKAPLWSLSIQRNCEPLLWFFRITLGEATRLLGCHVLQALLEMTRHCEPNPHGPLLTSRAAWDFSTCHSGASAIKNTDLKRVEIPRISESEETFTIN